MQIIGVDEVGRGSVAGPVYVCGLLLNDDYPLLTNHKRRFVLSKYNKYTNVRDSKMVKPETRKDIVNNINLDGIQYTNLSCSAKLIDKFGIGVCISTMLIITIQKLYNNKNTRVLIDGQIKLLDLLDVKLVESICRENKIKNNIDLGFYKKYKEVDIFSDVEIIFERENKADDKYLSIAMASNVAKVERDGVMVGLSKLYPAYKWGDNKGYATAKHCEEIRKDPDNEYLRKTWITRILAKKN